MAGIVLAGLVILAGGFAASPAAAQESAFKQLDPRFPDHLDAFSRVDGSRVWVVAENHYLTRTPHRCSIELSVREDFAGAPDEAPRRTNPVAVLKRFEMGYELFGNPRTSTDLHAFVRLRFERVDNGAPLRVARIFFREGFGDGFGDGDRIESAARWTGEELDPDGFGKASMPVAKMDKVAIRTFTVGLGLYYPTVAVTLPELGEDRAYALGFIATLNTNRVLDACVCAFRDSRINNPFVLNCNTPLLDPTGLR